MKLFILEYIDSLLKKANYEYDDQTQSWCGSVDDLPGVYAQADNIEELRDQLVEVIEDYIIVSLQDNIPLPGFKSVDRPVQYV